MATQNISSDMLDRIFFIAERVLVFDGLDDVFDHIVKTSVALSKAEAATIRIFDMDTGTLKLVKGFHIQNGPFSQPALRLGEGLSGRVVLEGEPFSSKDISKEPTLSKKEIVKLQGVKSMLSIPLKTKENTLGCITVFRKKREPFSAHEMLLLSIFGSQAVEAIEKTTLINELKKQAMFDTLTGVYNKHSLLKECDLKVKLALRHAYEISVLFIDIDNFKKFNDTQGHLLGDKLLSDFAKILKECCRKTDIVGRFGGEEFVILAPHTGKVGALALAQKIKDAIDVHPFIGREKAIHITFSAGLAAFPDDSIDITEVIRKADEAMYLSKRNGKNKITVWDE